LPETAAALAVGQIGVGHAEVLAAGTEEVPDAVVAAGEPPLLEAARRLSPHRLRTAVTHWRAYAVPEQAERDFAGQHDRRRLFVSSTIDGLVMLDGVLDAEAGNTVLTALSALAGPGGGEDRWTSAQRRADALVELARHALHHADLPDTRGERPYVTVTIDLPTLLSGTGAAELDFTGPIPAERARQLACDAGISRILVAGASQPLDVGRRTRTVPTQRRRALAARDGGCRFPGCDRPPAWCDAHHIRHWVDGGPTVLANLALLCRLHHTMLHQGWTLFLHPDGTSIAHPPPDRPKRHHPPPDRRERHSPPGESDASGDSGPLGQPASPDDSGPPGTARSPALPDVLGAA
jgi:hypothetical protein